MSMPLPKIGPISTIGFSPPPPPPPVCLICKVLIHLSVCIATGTLVVPIWRSAYFWPRLCFDGLHGNGFVHDWVMLPDLPNLFEGFNLRSQFSSIPFGGSAY